MTCRHCATIVFVLSLFVTPSAGAGDKKSAAPSKDAAAWKALFDGKSLAGWKSAGYIGGGKIQRAFVPCTVPPFPQAAGAPLCADS